MSLLGPLFGSAHILNTSARADLPGRTPNPSHPALLAFGLWGSSVDPGPQLCLAFMASVVSTQPHGQQSCLGATFRSPLYPHGELERVPKFPVPQFF